MRIVSVLVCLGMVLPCVALQGQETEVQITFGEKRDVDPAVSPDGKHLAFASNRAGGFNIFLLTFGKPGIIQLTQGKKDDRYPSWSADNRTILFNSERTGNDNLYEMAADGSAGFLQLTDAPDVEEFASFAPKGSGMLYVRSPKKRIQIKKQNTIVYAASKTQANTPLALSEGFEARFSPDGETIVFVSNRTKNSDIWRMNLDGTMPTQLTTDPKDDINPCFSPDGKYIVFASKRTGNFDLWMMQTDGSNPRQLTTNPADETQPFWSSGGYIYFVRAGSAGQSNIFRIKAP